VEEVAELVEEMEKLSKQPETDISLVVSEVGDVCWYLYALCNSLDDITPVPSFSSKLDLLTMETLCVFLKKKCNFLPHVGESLFRLGVGGKRFGWACNMPFLQLAKFWGLGFGPQGVPQKK